MAIIYSYSFGTNEAQISDGGNWTSGVGGMDHVETTGGVARSNAADTDHHGAHFSGTALSRQQYAKATNVNADNGSVSLVGVATRLVSSSDCSGYYLYYRPEAANELQFWKLTGNDPAGGFSLIASWNVAAAANCTIELRSIGLRHYCYYNDALQGVVWDNDYQAGQTGVAFYVNGGAVGNATMGDFETGNVDTAAITGYVPPNFSDFYGGAEGTLDEGGFWSNDPGGWITGMQRVGDGTIKSKATPTADHSCAYYTGMLTGDQSANAICNLSSGWAGVATRIQGASDGACYLAFVWDAPEGRVVRLLVAQESHGDFFAINHGPVAEADAASVPNDYLIELESRGNQHKVYLTYATSSLQGTRTLFIDWTHPATGAASGYLVNNGAGYAAGTTSIQIDTGSGSFVAGELIKFTGTYGTYTVVSHSGSTLTFKTADQDAPFSQAGGLDEAIADNAAIVYVARMATGYPAVATGGASPIHYEWWSLNIGGEWLLGSGGATTGGSAEVAKGKAFTPAAAGAVFGGGALWCHSYSYVGSGGAVFGGEATAEQIDYDEIPVGGLHRPVVGEFLRRPQTAIYQHLPAPAFSSLSSMAAREDTGAHIALVEVEWSTGTGYYSFVGTRTPSQHYDELLQSISPIRRMASVSGALSFGTASIRLVNRSRVFSILWHTAHFRNRLARIRYLRIDEGYASTLTVYEGKIIRASLDSGVLELHLRDSRFEELFKANIAQGIIRLVRSSFSELPEGQVPVIVPLVYGSIGTAFGGPTGGAVPAYLIEITGGGDYRYVLCVGPAINNAGDFPVTELFTYGSTALATPVYVSETVDGQAVEIAEFDIDVRDADRPDELEWVTHLDGIYEDGATIRNPVRALEHFLVTFGALTSGDFDAALQTAAKAQAEALGYAEPRYRTFGAAITDGDVNYRSIIERFDQSFAMSTYMTRGGELATFVMSDDLDPTPTLVVDDETDIVAGTLKIMTNEDVATVLQFNFLHRQTFGQRGDPMPGDYFQRQSSYPLPSETVALGGVDIRKSVNLWYVGRPFAALQIARIYWEYFRSEAQYLEFELPIRFFRHVELNRYIEITHWQGTSALGGYANITARIVEVQLRLNARDARVWLRCFKRGPITAIARDDFDRADATSLGADWSEDESAAGVFQIYTDAAMDDLKCLRSVDGSGVALWDASFGPDQLASLTYKDSNGAHEAGVCVRGSGTRTSFTGYVLIEDGAASFSLRKYVAQSLAASSGTSLGTYTPAGGVNEDDCFELRAEGTTISAYLLSGTNAARQGHSRVVISVTDADIATGAPGLVRCDADAAASEWVEFGDFFARDF